jgi:hypothetical protein
MLLLQNPGRYPYDAPAALPVDRIGHLQALLADLADYGLACHGGFLDHKPAAEALNRQVLSKRGGKQQEVQRWPKVTLTVWAPDNLAQ